MDNLTIRASGIAVSVDLSVGHISDLAVETGGRLLRPLHRAPWIDEPHVPAEAADGLKRLSGDFLCAPFSASDIEPAPPHGWPANSAWETTSSEAIDGGWRARFRLVRRVMGATVEKTLVVRDGHPFLYQEHGFTGGSGAISVAHHAMTAMKEGGRLAFSPKRFAMTPEASLEPDPARGRFMLAYPGRSTSVTSFPTARGGSADLTEYPAGARNEDFVMLAEADHRGLGWTAVARKAEQDLVLVLKDPDELPTTMLWISNGGRDYAPWSGRHVGVLGIEDGRTAVGHAASIGDNPLRREGVATAFVLGGTVSFRQVIGALAPDVTGIAPTGLGAVAGLLRLRFAEGTTQEVPFDAEFLRRRPNDPPDKPAASWEP